MANNRIPVDPTKNAAADESDDDVPVSVTRTPVDSRKPLDRTLETREREAAPAAWKRPETLPNPHDRVGYAHHWVRISTLGQADATNVSGKLREGWEPCRAVDYPEIVLVGIENERFKDNIVIGGLMLCKTPNEFVAQRNKHFADQAKAQIQSVDNNFMRENDARSPLFTERKSSVSFGKGQ
jgi:hypothetical protein